MEKHFLLWVEQIILPKNIFIAQIEIIQIFTFFVRSAPVDIPSKIKFSKNCLKLWKTLPVMSGTNNFDKKYFLSTILDRSIFHHFCKVRACRYSFKNSIFQKLPKIVEKHFLWWVEQIILPNNIILAQFKIFQIFTIFVRSAPVDFLLINQFSKKLPKIVEKHFLWWVEQIILSKNIFLAQFKIVQIFTIFVRSAPVKFLQKLNFPNIA